ncbi:hypothetical protein H1S01_04085 [Heliobacterium chlorum]|uniref:Uncharacterized protein n=1 Tax=Heliobacterium chlorum TaxID=2698 RepID=A0ABR7T087_HELCL|nr:hypothetical protein [Heliobacterium chlorum]MBC9783690.1 hypothetical protein [Heliobacterium chlorum]
MFVYRVAYRWPNGEVEGFLGIGAEKDIAEADARERIASRIRILKQKGLVPSNANFNEKALITSEEQVTDEEYGIIQNDWDSRVLMDSR